jgi:hypothetical protein
MYDLIETKYFLAIEASASFATFNFCTVPATLFVSDTQWMAFRQVKHGWHADLCVAQAARTSQPLSPAPAIARRCRPSTRRRREGWDTAGIQTGCDGSQAASAGRL